MDVTTQRRFLAATAGGLLLAAGGSIAWSLSAIDAPSVAATGPRDRAPLKAEVEPRRQSTTDAIVVFIAAKDRLQNPLSWIAQSLARMV